MSDVEPETNSFKYDLFISYSTDPDYRLVRDLEPFLESFHGLRTPQELPLHELSVCVDGSDFSLSALQADAEGSDDAVTALITSYLGQSRRLLVLCSAQARESRWIDIEIEWFLEHQGASSVILAVSEGADPVALPDTVFSPRILQAGLHRKPWYDFRAFRGRQAREWSKVKELDDERVRLAADLNGQAAGEIQPIWFREQARIRRRRAFAAAAAVGLIVVAGAIAVWQGVVAKREQGLKLISSTYELLYRDPSSAFLKAYRASTVLPGRESDTALRTAYKVAVLHHYNRRESGQMTGSGPSYLARRWKQGDLFTEASPDGRYRLMVTERGPDGPRPPGEVYLLNNESLRMIELESCFDGKRRVEDVAFDRTSRFVFVTRHYLLNVYSLSGQCAGTYRLSCCTKSPVHLVEGFLRGGLVLAAETKGGLWLVNPDPAKGHRLRHELQREFHGDAALLANLSPSGERAVVVFESGRASLVSVVDGSKPVLRDFIDGHVLFAAFHPGREDTVVTAGDDGMIRHWRVTPDELREVSAQHLPGVAVDWVVFSDDGRQLLAVGDNKSLSVIDLNEGAVLVTMDEANDIDWAAARAVPTREVEVTPEMVQASDAAPFPEPGAKVVRTFTDAGNTWVVTEHPGDILPSYRTLFRMGDTALSFAGLEIDTRELERHGELLWLKTRSSFEPAVYGPLVRLDGSRLRFYPRKGLYVRAIVSLHGRQYLATGRGLYAFDGKRLSRVSRERMDVRQMVPIGEQLWLATRQGGYVLDGDRLIRVTAPFLAVTTVEQAGGEIWLLTKGDKTAPAYLVDDYIARPLPHPKAKITKVMVARGRTWLLGRPGLFYYDGVQAPEVASIAEEVIELIEQDGRLLAKTRTLSWLFPSPGPTYEVDPNTFVASPVGQ